MHKIFIFVERLRKIGINVEIAGNFPWVYLSKINNIKVTELFKGNHGFTIAFLPVKLNKELEFTDITEVFKLIRKYINT